ncbi:VOC family protein [Nocardia bhagyanarayanae]|uniref:Catechol 2,3-dioxygenase-like lactoylglutathione lyase family enzyme n=1 Tax=Nocardia bhagyanarayanae TaxID=1215925 RepID=A0A543F4Q5_9NOCA|nr:VOC family protein [Nocardia bhagyanarayanae]TQM28813.1 catechol 2,3-dioxygenase-like lactoylglutathione lyase family enzyme [Nocardia bhagyanarayanae]
MPLGHLGINVTDLTAARTYYDEMMPLVDYEPFLLDDTQFAYRPANGKVGAYLFFYRAETSGYSRATPGLQHLAFMVRTRAAVRATHSWAASRGDEIVHAPREFPEYPPPYFATFWLGYDGVLLEAVCHKDA